MVTQTNTISLEPNEKVLSNTPLIPREEYRSILRELLPTDYFKPEEKHIAFYLLCMTLYICGIFSILSFNLFLPLKLLISAVMGITLASLTFFLHDLCHGSIVRSKQLEYLLGFSIGLFNLFPTLFWKRIHNYHHAKTGDIDDPDRSYIKSESPKNIIQKIAYRTRLSREAFHPFLSLLLMSTGFFWYFSNGLYGTFLHKFIKSKDNKVGTVHNLFKIKHKVVIIFELLTIFSFQAFLFLFVSNKNLLTYSLISIIPIGIAHFIAMLYIHTNHFLSPLTGKIDDPLVNSLSLKNPKLVDKIFSNFSHHTEHHLFPYMSSTYYPKVRELLLRLYPNRFRLIPMHKAIKLLSQTPRIYNDFTHLVTTDRKQIIECPCK